MSFVCIRDAKIDNLKCEQKYNQSDKQSKHNIKGEQMTSWFFFMWFSSGIIEKSLVRYKNTTNNENFIIHGFHNSTVRFKTRDYSKFFTWFYALDNSFIALGYLDNPDINFQSLSRANSCKKTWIKKDMN